MRIYSNKERSKAIKEELKKLGITSKQVSVRSGNCGYSDSSYITIKDVSVRIGAVKKACEKFESIDYDKYSGEILEGGNTYIIVQYDYEALRNAENKKMAEVEELLKGIDKGVQKKIERKDFDYVLFSDDRGFYMACYEKGAKCGRLGLKSWTFESFKQSIARAFVTEFEDYVA